ncbi:hypothetical protein Naga_100019g65 [Nannochloropsis gaditana]|uniref:Uncharacterized protein n=1 Tax=Nannochloropsis gaditana TaxID=72520 RepID=W7TD94_9STRA|nr:hypothetical protein Naga_100019g65 [Nannochloropsis gaditana]
MAFRPLQDPAPSSTPLSPASNPVCDASLRDKSRIRPESIVGLRLKCTCKFFKRPWCCFGGQGCFSQTTHESDTRFLGWAEKKFRTMLIKLGLMSTRQPDGKYDRQRQTRMRCTGAELKAIERGCTPLVIKLSTDTLTWPSKEEVLHSI